MGLRGYDDFHPEGAKVLTIQAQAPPTPEPVIEPRPSKYHNKRTLYAGVLYDSKAEADYAAKLDEERARIPGMWWIGQPKFRLGCPLNTYRADFLVHRPDLADPTFAIDVKGLETKDFLRNVRLWREYGPCRLVIVRRVGKGWTADIIPQGGEE